MFRVRIRYRFRLKVILTGCIVYHVFTCSYTWKCSKIPTVAPFTGDYWMKNNIRTEPIAFRINCDCCD